MPAGCQTLAAGWRGFYLAQFENTDRPILRSPWPCIVDQHSNPASNFGFHDIPQGWEDKQIALGARCFLCEVVEVETMIQETHP